MLLEEFNDAVLFTQQQSTVNAPAFERCPAEPRSVAVAHIHRAGVCVERDL